LSLGRMHYALALEYCGKGDEAVEEHRRACLTSPEMPVLRAAEGACYARLGHRQKARHVLEELQEVRRSAYVDGYYLALLLAGLGRKNEAFEELERARQQNSPVFFS
jgi:Flp pilus assembly protein TadD